MYKELIVSIIVIICIITLNNVTWDYTKKVSEEITSNLENVRTSFKDEDEMINEKATKLYERWEEVDDTLAYYIEHNELEKIKTELTEIRTFSETKEYNNGIESIDKCKYLLEHLDEKTKVTLDNIF